MKPSITKRCAAELIGTLWLVLGGCGTAVLALPRVGVGGVALAFGLTVLTMAYALGGISGGHFNPAVTVGVAAAGRFAWREVPSYVAAQVVGALAGAALVYAIASGMPDFDLATHGLATNGYGLHSPTGFSMLACAVTELVLACGFVLVILGSTEHPTAKAFAPLPIGLALTLIHLISIPVTNTSVNPARSTGPAIIQGGWALAQLWLFWLVPIAGGLLAAAIYRALTAGTTAEVSAPGAVPLAT